MAIGFSPAVLDAAERAPEVELTTFGRKTGKPARVTIWITREGPRLFVRSGGGLGRDWPRNLLAHGRGVLHVGGRDVPVLARHVSDPDEARAVGRLIRQRHSVSLPVSAAGEPLTPGEQATFELVPAAGPVHA